MSGAEIVTVLFTDLVGSTELLDRLGDDAAEEVRRVHFGLLREVVAARRGQEVKNVGDGLMVVFASAVDAVDCAVGIQRAVARHNRRGLGPPLRVRVGLHVGEPIRAEGDYFGTVVNVAKRLCDAAEPDQIVASKLVADLVGSRGTPEFRDLGLLALKGLTRDLPAAEVIWKAERPGSPTADIAYRILGPVEALGADGTPVRLASPRQRLLLACLLAQAGHVLSPDQLVETLWDDQLPGDPKDALQSQVARLRQRLGAGAPLETTPAGYRFTAPERVDAVRFERLMAEGRRLAGDPETALVVWDDALSLWRGDAFLDLAGSPTLQAAASRLTGLRLEAAEARVAALLGAGRLAEALTAGQVLAEAEPLRERPVELRMRTLAAGGRYVEALRVYDAFRRLLADEVGLDPSPELRALHGEILRHERPAETAPAAAAGEAAPAVGAPADAPLHAGGLPATAGALVGREATLAAVVVALGRSRLVTLTGPGGIGKSRLALETGHAVAVNQRDGAWLCELAPVPEDSGVAFAVAAAVGVRQIQGTTLEASLLEGLSGRAALLVVDNCEHVLDGVVPLLERILGRCPGVRVLATSRERLAAEGEAVVEVPPLEVPADADDTEAAWRRPAPALALLRDRAEAIRPGSTSDTRASAALVDIARRLDGLPLALELAAARVATMGATEVSRRLDHRFTLLTGGRRSAPARHRTLRATVEWSYDMLDETERGVFERSSVFVGGFTLDAAEVVCTDGDDVPMADVVAALVDKSILLVDNRGPATRYRMLETLREFGQERLAARGAAVAVEETHARHYVALAWRAEPELRGPAEAEWVRILHAEVGNLGAAHRWALRTGCRALAAELSAGLIWYGYIRMRMDVLGWAEELADDDPAVAGPHLPRVLFSAALAAWLRGEMPRARSVAERAVAVAHDETSQLWGTYVCGAVALTEGRLPESFEAVGRAGELARAAGDHYLASRALGALAIAQSYAGDLAAAVASAGACRLEAARSGAPSAIAWTSYALGEVLMATDPEAALAHLDRAVSLAATAEAHFNHGVALVSATSLRIRHSDVATAAAALADVVAYWHRFGNWRQQWVTLRHAVELFARAGDDAAAATVLGAIEARDSTLYGPDADRLAALRVELLGRDHGTEARLADGASMHPPDLLVYARRCLAVLVPPIVST